MNFGKGTSRPPPAHTAFYRECKERLPKEKRIARFRADSAFYQAELINELEKDNVFWTITADQDAAVSAIIKDMPEDAWKEPRKGCGYELAEAVHTMNKTKKSFRLVIKRELRKQKDLFDLVTEKYHHYAVATNWPEEEKDAQAVLTWHNQRGQAVK